MNPRVAKVRAEKQYCLAVTFTNGEERVYDASVLLEEGGVFAELKDATLFRKVRVAYGTVLWSGGQDICPDTLYMDSVPASHKEPVLVKESQAAYSVKRRSSRHRTPK